MVFSTLTFLLVFLPALLVLYFLIPKKYTAARNYVLLVFSVFFYAWGEPANAALILVCVFLTYALSFRTAEKNKAAFTAAALVNIIPLIVFKYADFVIFNINKLPGIELPALGLTLPIGISFYTFQVLTYVIDLYWGHIALQRNPAYLALYVFFFPQLIAGPIVRYIDVEKEIISRSTSLNDFTEGARRFIIGFSKKMLIANQAGYVVSIIKANPMASTGPLILWISVISYGVQIYFDFSGYSDMAIGLGRIFGFHFLENFNKPYISRSVTEFWRRWHISLSSFFRDYVYIPLGGSRVRTGRHIFNLFVVWSLTGLWHGAFWNYILWGIYYFVLLTLEKYTYGRALEKAPAFISRPLTFFFYMFGWAIFMFESNSFAEIGTFLGSLLLIVPSHAETSLRALGIQGGLITVVIGLIISMLPEMNKKRKLPAVIEYPALIFLFCISIIMIVGESFNPFIYFRF